MNIDKLNRAYENLKKCYQLLCFWEIVSVSGKFNRLFKNHPILGEIAFDKYQLFVIKTCIFFEGTEGKHSIQKLINILNNDRITQNMQIIWDRCLQDHAETINNMKHLRSKHFAHRDDFDISDIEGRIGEIEQYYKLLNSIESLLNFARHLTDNQVYIPFDREFFKEQIYGTFDIYFDEPQNDSKFIKYKTEKRK